jgi:ornithine carbamoyltransferase
MRHILTLFDLASDELPQIFAISRVLKAEHARGAREPRFAGHVMALLFEKPSLRTRVSFETAMAHLGGTSLFLGKDVGWGERESVADFAQVISEYVDVVVCRANSHQSVEDLARHSEVPVVNGLTDLAHPCQALADVFTLQEKHGALAGLKLAYVGDANNVARSLAIASGHLEIEFAIGCPQKYCFDDEFLKQLRQQFPAISITQTEDPVEAVRDAAAVYTDVWASMGQENERAERQRVFAAYQVNSELLSHADASASFLHCLPAHRGEEVTDEVIDGPHSAVICQAGNRMHLQKGLIAWLLQGTKTP